jgi:hypothetical protein
MKKLLILIAEGHDLARAEREIEFTSPGLTDLLRVWPNTGVLRRCYSAQAADVHAPFIVDALKKLACVERVEIEIPRESEPRNRATIVQLADWIERLLTPVTGKTLEERVREVAMEMIRAKQILVEEERDT